MPSWKLLCSRRNKGSERPSRRPLPADFAHPAKGSSSRPSEAGAGIAKRQEVDVCTIQQKASPRRTFAALDGRLQGDHDDEVAETSGNQVPV